MLKKSGWSPKEDPRVRDEFSKIHMKLRQWARNYGVLAFEDIEEVPAAEKDRIIGLLDGYSFETDWKTLITKASIPRNKIPAILLQSLLAKDVFEWVFGDPFFSFAEIDNTSSLPNSKEWKHVYREMIKVDEPEAHIWRSQTLRILSTVTNPSTESHLARRIRLLSSQKAAGFLTSPASLLLRQASKPGSGDKCTQDVQKLYHEVAEFALLLWTQRTFIKLYSQHELPKFYISNPKTEAHSLHHLDEDDTRLDGKDVLLFVQPAVVAFGNEDAENYDRSKIWAPATVMVDERS
ncbi:hypothetical protein BGW36DRAFT_308588 [Talaromyces proteolyticus]|uniref:Uncharacterized protein n=1 Tax=Talaromyces proteolyticus TaxID=1131652 RepID=A0AAD4KDY5_9EURO|nr:uncharacterized protein BGW36DRAFT_308588 [Talaromyces proteolyticus]KAH8689554.1 hypothetical protein BGW36DRAFT_308588 [Talaromyces proteolyticus]